ncbi:GntR family transcriptional regulator [Streptomyces sp. NPDC087532]|uniref:GntR family transcriptional regulator n=1 Tax=unclassified Streptomyces TaxID=2593676 RepID=UPI00331A61A3
MSDDDVQAVRRWVRLSCTEPGTHLPALTEIAGDLRLSVLVVRSALEQLAADGLVTLHDGYRLYSVGTTTPTERAYRLMRTAIHRTNGPGERFMTRDRITQVFGIGTKVAAAAVRQLMAEALLTGPRGQYVNAYSPAQQRRRVRQLRERASDLRREALELMRTAREIEQEPPTGCDSEETLPLPARAGVTDPVSRCEGVG